MGVKNTVRLGAGGIERAYCIGEAGNSHNGDAEMAMKMIDVAIDAGCNAIKFQKRHMPSIWIREELDKEIAQVWQNAPEKWGKTYGEIRNAIELDIHAFRTLREYCRGKIDFGITPFDLVSLGECDDLDVDFFKIAGFSITDIPLIEEIGKRKKRVVMSCSICSEKEIVDALKALEPVEDLVLLHCVSSYPLKVEDANMRLITWLQKFGHPVGFSDHTSGISLGPVAVTLGAQYHEKHFTLDRTLPGFDHSFSLEPTGLKKWVRDIRKAERALKGLIKHREVLPCEIKALKEKRPSVVAACDIEKGETIQRQMLTCKCPNRGISPNLIPEVIGHKATQDIQEDAHITFNMIAW